jgi:uncharacterized protein YciI
MLVAFYCKDKDYSDQRLRLEQLSAHLKWVEANMDVIKVAGPLKEEGNIVGSLYVLEASSVSEATALLRTDPYYKAGIWLTMESEEFSAYAGCWVGGANWPTHS